MIHTSIPTSTRRSRTRGVSLVFALIGLAVLSLAAIALVRSIDTGTLVLGNLSFKQDATRSSEQAAEQAIAWLTGVPRTTLEDDNTAGSYWATSWDTVDPTGGNPTDIKRAVIDWEGDGCASYPDGTFNGGCVTPVLEGDEVNGVKTQFVIFRMCLTSGAPTKAGNDCARPSATQRPGDVTRGDINYRKYERLTIRSSSSAEEVYFRIIVRTVGGRDAVSFSETILTY